jgi:hypothetical protein
MNGQNASSKDTTTTLGMVIKLCVQRYYEIFYKVQDVSEAVEPIYDASGPSVNEVDLLLSMASSSTAGATSPQRPVSIAKSSHPPSAWNKAAATGRAWPHLAPHLASSSNLPVANNDTRSICSSGSNGTWLMPKSHCLFISIEKVARGKPGTRSIKLGRLVPMLGHADGQGGSLTGTIGKSRGATVTMVSVTTTRFFTPVSRAEGENNGIGGHG